jgi:hypothetical protein
LIYKKEILAELIYLNIECDTMEILESVGWIALGFVPMLGGLELVSRIVARRAYLHKEKKSHYNILTPKASG